MKEALRIVVVAPDLAVEDQDDDYAVSLAERSRSLRIGLLTNGFNLVASLPADVFLTERLAQLQPDMIIVDAESDARDVKAAVAAGVSAYIVRACQPSASAPFWTWPWPAFNMNSRCARNRPTRKLS